MKTLTKILSCLFLVVSTIDSFSQTPISGMIDADSTLRKNASPFLVSSDLVISPDGQITIEPGVEVRFASGVKLEVRGTLIAKGTKTDSITFTSNSGTSKGSWYGIDIKNTQGGNATFDYCNFKYASTAIYEGCCGGGKDSISHSSFFTNTIAIGGYTGSKTPVDSCYFSGNTYCLTSADKAVTNCVFENNEYGLYETERISVSNSTFTNHTQVALYGGRGIVSNCTIENNNIGIKAFFEGFTVKSSTISNNDIGIELGDYDGYIPPIDSNQICNNTTYNVKNNSSYNTELYTNCWCSSDSATVEDKIYDGYDNASKGLVSYDIYNATCDSVILKVDKTAIQSDNWILANSPYIITENYVVFPSDTLLIEPGVEIRFASGVKLEVRGTLIAKGTKTDSITFTSNSGTSKGSWYGIDIKNTQGGNATFDYCNFKYASTAIYEGCCGGGKDSISHSSFLANTIAIGGYTGSKTPVDSCYFSGNTYCLTSADKAVTNCVFENNEYGLYETERISVSNSTFTNHTQVALYGGRGTVSNCTIENNNIGIKAFFEGFTVKSSTISNNDIGMELGDYDGYIPPIDSNQICNNTTYNVKNNSSYNTELYTNCWCSSDSATVEDKIYDGYDNASKGLVSYDIYNATCDSVILKVDKTAIQSDNWILANSPYIITENYVVFPSDTLLIEPGVEIRFASGVKLEVRGTLIAKGTKTDSITFTSNSGTSKGSWYGIDIKNTQGGNATFDYCNFKYASTAIYEGCCGGGKDSISHSSFLANTIAIGGYTGSKTPVDSCYFSGNTYCLTSADKAVTNCVFENNEYGLYETERISVSNSTFTNHTQVALYGGRGTVSNCTIENNNIGIKAFFEGFTVKSSTISNNDIGMELGDYDGYIPPIDSNQICNNTTYNVKNNSSYNTELYTNCWCNSDSTTVEDKIYDGWDNVSKGLVDYTLYSSNCITPIFKSVKLENKVIYFTTGISISENTDFKIYPNPTSDILFIQGADNINNVKIYSYSGKLMFNRNLDSNDKVQLDLSDLKSGLYLIELHQDGGIRKEKLIKLE